MPGLRPDIRWSEFGHEVVDQKATTLVRLFKHPGGQWKPPPAKYRNLRVDPPPGHKSRFAVLYTATRLDTIGQECQILAVDLADRWTVNLKRAAEHQVARYAFSNPGVFIPIDGQNAGIFGLDAVQASGGYEPFQRLSLALFERFSHVAHGISWRSYHRHQNGRVYAVWHSRKAKLGLKVDSLGDLEADAEWIAMKAGIPGLIELS